MGYLYKGTTLTMNYQRGFTTYLKHERGRSDKTIAAYLGDVDRFARWLEPHVQPPVDWQEVKTSHIRLYLSDLEASPSYFHRVHSSLNAWFHYLVEVAELRTDNPVAKVNKPKKAQHHPPALSLSDVKRLIETAFETSRPSERLRNWTLITVLVNTGLRVSELCNLNVSDIKHKEGYPHSLTVIGKGNKQRKVILSDNGKTALYQWLKERKRLLYELPPTADREAVWIVPAGRYQGRRMTAAAVRKMLAKLGTLASLQQGVYPHLLRHTFATEAVRSGARLHALKDALGHSRLDTTGIYLHADEAELEAMAAVLPDVLGSQ
jgi:site-specific recombinase XerD